MKGKKELRVEVLKLRDAMSEEEIRRKSSLIENNLLSLPEFTGAKTIMFYVSKGSEVETHKLIRDALGLKKNVVVPFCVDRHHKIVPSRVESFGDLTERCFGILQPAESSIKEVKPDDIDVFIVPGNVFDESGHRIGWGRGFYDRFFAKAPAGKLRIGLAFDFQVVEKIGREKHDVVMDVVVTEKRVRRIKGIVQ